MKALAALVGAFNQEKALVGAFSVIEHLRRWIVCSSTLHGPAAGRPSRAELQNEIKSVLTLKDLKTLIFFDTRD